MMKSLKSIFVLLFISSLFVASCKKDDAQSTSDILSSKTWEFEVVTTTSTDPDVVLSITFANSLLQGTKYNFKSDGTYKITASDASEIESGTWTLSSDSKTLTTKETSSTDSTVTAHVIKSISTSDLKLEDTQTTSDNVEYKYVLDFK
ncbi:MAG: hypothetical protein KBA06_02970 [Saprospiraceae bacterium]|nr:hypothetical protein [Saprospiraceae bacterium]